MSSADSRIFICSCEKTLPLDEAALARGGLGRVTRADQLCGAQIDQLRTAMGDSAPITIACTQEVALFTEVAEDLGSHAPLTFVNIRETGGWSAEAARSGPKAAALIAAAREEMPPIQQVTLKSEGVILIYGCDEVAIEAGRKLADRLDVTVMLSRPADVVAPATRDFPVIKGHVRTATGVLGAFELAVDETALPAPSSRARLVFGAHKNGATSSCDIILDLSGYGPMFTAADLRPGYLRADPRDRAAVEKAVAEAGQLVGVFDKPRYVNFNENACAHSRSRITGCVRCLDFCPTGAITPDGNHVKIDPAICAGCGSCASVCPTGAASYALPPSDAVMRRLRRLLTTYRAAGGETPVVLLHDGEHGAELIDALARYGEGLPAHVLPLRLNEVTQVGPEVLAGAFAFGATGLALLTRAKPKHDIAGLHQVVEMTATIVTGLGFGEGVLRVIETDDPDQLLEQLKALTPGVPSPHPAQFEPRGAKRPVLEATFRELHVAAPAPVAVIALEKGAPFGGVEVNVDGCTLCHACVTACPTGALSDNSESPMLRFTEAACVQCGLCAATCPEKVITLKPQIDFTAWREPPRILKEEEPFCCIACASPFSTKSMIDKITGKLANKHWMFSGENARRLDVVRMCEKCRVEAVMNEGFDPYGAPQRPPVMTTEDYLKARDANGRDPVES